MVVIFCNDKIKFRSEELALNYAEMMKRKGIFIHPYHCAIHNCWHLGHAQKEFKSIDERIHNIFKLINNDLTENRSFIRMKNLLNNIFKRIDLKEIPRFAIDINKNFTIKWNKSFYFNAYVPGNPNQKINFSYGKLNESHHKYGAGASDRQVAEILINNLKRDGVI